MNFAFFQIIICISVFYNNILVVAGAKGKIRSREILMAMKPLENNGHPWKDANPTRIISEGFGLHASTESTFPIDETKVVAGVVKRMISGTKILVALFCRLMKGQRVAIWVTRDETAQEIKSKILAFSVGIDSKPSPAEIKVSVDTEMKQTLESPARLQFNAMLAVMRNAGAVIYEENGKNDNAIFESLDVAFVYDGYSANGDKMLVGGKIAALAHGPLDVLRYLQQEKKAAVWAREMTNFLDIYLNPQHEHQKKVVLADHCTAINYFTGGEDKVQTKQHITLHEIVYNALEKVGKESEVPHDVFVTTYTGSEEITEEDLQDSEKLQAVIELFQLSPQDD